MLALLHVKDCSKSLKQPPTAERFLKPDGQIAVRKQIDIDIVTVIAYSHVRRTAGWAHVVVKGGTFAALWISCIFNHWFIDSNMHVSTIIGYINDTIMPVRPNKNIHN